MNLSNRIISVDRTPVCTGKNALSAVDKLVRSLHVAKGEIFILVDKNTKQHCLPLLLDNTVSLEDAQLLEIDGGEGSKTLLTAERLWNELLVCSAGRQSLLVNLGGGVVSDLGGFVAAGFKRGIRYINIPTSLMGQCDAAIGGKTSVNMGGVKNQVGFFHPSKGVFIFPEFLRTLPPDHARSGLAEIIKCALVGNKRLWRKLLRHPIPEILALPHDHVLWKELVNSTVKLKNAVVMKDFREQKYRKILNFGHTVGHALESCSVAEGKLPLLHGDAVAAGMICAAFLSHHKSGLAAPGMQEITSYLAEGFPPFPLESSKIPEIMRIMVHDKKSFNGQPRFTLISQPGIPTVDIVCDQAEILEALAFYQNF
ncbi:MAG: 3-dehydroquinate synthase family protein [Bacteroidota bacterium]